MKTSVKVSGFVSRAQHVELATLAVRNDTTIGAIVSYAIRETVKQLKRDPELGKRLDRDQRRAEATTN